MGLELYLDLLSQPCRAVYIFARKNNIPFELKQVELFTESILGTEGPAATGPGQQQAGQRQVPTAVKKVPVLRDEEGFVLAEGPAILLYLSRKYHTPDHWYPAELRVRAKVDEYLSWHQANLRASAPKALWVKVLIPLFTGQPLPPEKLQEVLAGLRASLQQLEESFLQDKPFLAGDEISLADLVAVVELMQPVGVGCDVFAGRPRLAGWRSRVEAAVGAELFLQAHEPILNVEALRSVRVDPRLRQQLAPLLLQVLK
ncbi:hypothetical protein lerEdw1_019389 [Lerista edwardsae]|nr:hypothetical protein lerEdw1_019389 [Lerista edwardsae]